MPPPAQARPAALLAARESPAPNPDPLDWLLKSAIVLRLGILLYYAVAGRIFQPLLAAASANVWTQFIVRPSAIWVVMGTLLLAFRTALLVILSARDPATLPRVLVAIGLMSTFYMLYYLRSEKSLDFIYGIAYAYFAFFTLFWIFRYAVLTVRARSWLTR